MRRLGLRAPLTLLALAASLSAACVRAAEAGKTDGTPDTSRQTWALACPGDGRPIAIREVDRATIDRSLYLDVAGLRLYAADANSLKRITQRVAQPSAARHLVRSALGKRLAETGIEPDAVPVRGSAGKTLGTQGMVFIDGGEYVRPGEYYTSMYLALERHRGQRYNVRVSAFYIDPFKVTNAEYCAFLNDGNSAYWTPWYEIIRKDTDGRFTVASPEQAKLPVLSVNWYQAAGYAAWAGKRLPTEAEWEFAAGGKEGRKYPWGDDEPDLTRANYFGKLKRHTPGDAFPAGRTPDGMFDMVGNAAEWCADFYDKAYYDTAPPGGVMTDPSGPATGTARHEFRRMFKGMCHGPDQPEFLLCTKRHARPPLLSSPAGIGFRCVKSAAPAAKPEAAAHLRLAENLVKYEGNPVLDVGRPGQWDDGRCGCFTVSKVGQEFLLWYMGSGKANPWRIGLAASRDGIRWRRFELNPVLGPGAPGDWDDRQVSMPYVLKDGDTFYMWYSGAGRGGGFGLATSPDGVNWERHPGNPVLRGTGASCDPCVRKIDGCFHMWYCGRIGKAYRICHATSADGVRWQKAPSGAVLPLGEKGTFDHLHHAGPCILRVGDTTYMWYLGSDGTGWRMGLATSADGIHWKKSSANPVLEAGSTGEWDGGSLLGHDVLYIGGRFHVWYAAVTANDMAKGEHEQTIRIGYATSRGGEPTANGPAPPLAESPLSADQAKAIQKRWAAHLGVEVVRTNSVGMRMVLVPPGEFTMGTTRREYDTLLKEIEGKPWAEGAKGMWGFEVPAHCVRITKPFRLAAHEVTVAQFRTFADATGYKTEAERGWFRGKPSTKEGFPKFTWRSIGTKQADDEPVTHISWNDAVAFCKWLSRKEGRPYRLPTEAEWELACRAGTTTRWCCGNDSKPAAEYGWIDGDRPRPVGRKEPNAWGLYDMHGNVWEYCADWWAWNFEAYAKQESVVIDPIGPAEMPDGRPLRPLRGGSFDFGGSSRSACRCRVHQTTHRFRHLGFRVAETIKR